MDAVVKLAATKQLDKQMIQDIIIEAITSTLSKKLEPENDLDVFVEEKTGQVMARFKCLTVEQEGALGEISLEDARKNYDRYADLGDFVTRTMSMLEFEPKLVKIAQKAIQDKIRALEEEKIQSDFNKQKFTVVTGKIIWAEVDPLFVAFPLAILVTVAVSLVTKPFSEDHIERCFGKRAWKERSDHV